MLVARHTFRFISLCLDAGADLELNTWGGHLVGVVSFNECGDAETKDF